MSEPENVLARWSRLKRRRPSRDRKETRELPSGVAEGRAEARDAPDAQAPAPPLPAPPLAAPPLDVSSLPPIESIVAGSDIRAFLQKGVPAALTRAALRQAWSSDPAIRDFIEIAENQWDFADPKGIPGFGPLAPTDDVQRLVAQALGELRTDPQSAGEGHLREGKLTPPGGGEAIGAPQARDVRAEVSADRGTARASDAEPLRALQHEDSAIANSDTPSRKRRKHGGAMPS